MIQGNRGDRQAGAVVGLHYHLHQADYWYVADRHAPGSCCTTCARAGPTDGATLTLDLGRRRGRTTTAACSSRPASRTGSPALTDMTITYLVDGYYNPADELGVAWDDPDVGADWGVADPILSKRDQANPLRSRDRAAVAPALGAAHMRTRP